LLLFVGVAATVVALGIVPPVDESELVGRWSCNCSPLDPKGSQHSYYGSHVSFDLEGDGRYFYAVRKYICGTVENYDGPGWKLKPVQPIRGRYVLSFGDGDDWPIRFSRDHETMYVNVWGDEEVLVKVE